jgi:hypothetical protein
MNIMSATAKTFYVVQPFIRGKRGGLKAEQAIQAPSANAALLRAERMAESKAGVLVFSQTSTSQCSWQGMGMCRLRINEKLLTQMQW